MSENQSAIRFRHHFLVNGAVLTVCTNLNHILRTVDIGWSLFNPGDDKWVRKVGNDIARDRIKNETLTFNLSEDEPVICDYLSLRSLMLILASAKRQPKTPIDQSSTQTIPRASLTAIEYEMIRLISLLGQRIGVPSITG